MAGRDSNVTYYTKPDKQANTNTAERNTKRPYASPVPSVSRTEEADTTAAIAEGRGTDWWNTGIRHRNRSVSFPLEGFGRPSFAEGVTAEGSIDPTVPPPLDTSNMSFLPDTLSAWSTTFQNSGWLDIYLNTTATQSLQ